MRALRLGAWQPQFFNQNGECANLAVLSHWLSLAGIEVKIASIEERSQLASLDFLVVGDAGRAAVRQFGTELTALAVERAGSTSGPLAMFFGKSFELVAGTVVGEPLPEVERVSDFQALATEWGTVRGYLNSRLKPMGLLQAGRFLGTSLHGPVLASSPQLRAEILKALVGEEVKNGGGDVLVLELEEALGWR